MKYIITKTVGTSLLCCLLAASLPLAAFAQLGPATLEQIGTPARVETRLGTLKFFDGLPDNATV
jgi:hypothetical protein